MEDGTLGINEPKVENSGMPQGNFLKRQKVEKEDGSYLGPDDFHIGSEVTICGHTFHICGCDRFTRWFFEENGVAIEEEPWRDGIFCFISIPNFEFDALVVFPKDEEIPIDAWQTNYRMRKARDRGGIPVTKGVMDDKDRMDAQLASFVALCTLPESLIDLLGECTSGLVPSNWGYPSCGQEAGSIPPQ